MVEGAENLLKNYNLTRDELDNSAINSYLKSRNALEKNYFNNEILPISINNVINS